MGQSRPLTMGEVMLARQVFADSIVYERVKVVRLPAFWHGHAAVSVFGQIFFPARYWLADFAEASDSSKIWLMHELTHVWQYQRGFGVVRAGLALWFQGGYHNKAAYFMDFHDNRSGAFARLNMEQQAETVAAYFAYKVLGYQVGASAERFFQGAFQEFLADPYSTALLPRHSRMPVQPSP